MSAQVQELIDKIKSEGVHEAEQRAREIEDQANRKAEEIVNEAKKHADQILNNAKSESKKVQESTHMALKQSARDLLLKLRKEIESTLMKVISSDVQKALSAEELADMIREIIKGYLQQNKDVQDIAVTLSEKDLKKLKDGYITKLKEKVKQPISFKSAEDIGAGFTISFDQGKSCFDFTDASLVDYLSGFLNKEVSSLIQDAASAKS